MSVATNQADQFTVGSGATLNIGPKADLEILVTFVGRNAKK